MTETIQDCESSPNLLRQKPSKLRGLWNFMTLRSYGNDLLTRSDKTYLIGMSLIMLLVSTAEALAWGYLGSTFSPNHQLVAWSCMGLFVFMLMWFFDRSLLTSDLLESEHIKTLNGEFVEKSIEKDSLDKIKNVFKSIWHYKSFLIRVGVVALSIYITAPYMTQIAFKADIENGIQNRYQEAVKSYKESLIKEMDKELERIALKIEQINEKLQAEVSGGKNSQSGRYGFGASAQSIQNELNDLKSEQIIKQAIKTKKVSEIELAVEQSNFPAMRALGIRIDKDSPVFRNEIVAELEKKEAFWHTEIGIRALLVILAVILFSMKLMQPRTLKIYYSSLLQEKWNLYCLGRFDEGLPVQDRSYNLLKSYDALPETFEKLIIKFSQNAHQNELLEKKQLDKEERIENERIENERLKAEKALESERLKIEQEKQLDEARVKHEQRILDEQGRAEHRLLKSEWHKNQISDALKEISDLEKDYLGRHSDEIESLKIKRLEIEEKLHAIELEFKTHAERVDARRQRVQESDVELGKTYQLLIQTRQRDDCERLQVLRLLEDIEKALLQQEERMKGQKAELLGFELTQKCVHENLQKQEKLLQKSVDRLESLEKPLEQVTNQRLKIEAHRMEIAGIHGVLEAPYALPHEDEMPFLIQKLRAQMEDISNADYLENSNV